MLDLIAENKWMLLIFTLIYLALHFTFYVVIGRNIKYFKSEKGIFNYHFVSFCSIMIILFISLSLYKLESGLCLVFSILSLHGIYSISFLELWSLSQGGYSISVLRSSPILSSDQNLVLSKLEAIGDDKFNNRIRSLSGLKIIREQDNLLYLTARGKITAKILFMISTLTNIKDLG